MSIDNVSLGSAQVTYDVQGFYLGWAGDNIGQILLSPISGDAVLFDDLSYSVVPIPAAVWLFGSSLGLLGWLRRK